MHVKLLLPNTFKLCVCIIPRLAFYTPNYIFIHPKFIFRRYTGISLLVGRSGGWAVGRSVVGWSVGRSVGLSAKSCTFNSSYSFIMIHLILGIHIIQ